MGTHAITIETCPAEIWPWLVQMGCRRAGWYSYDGLDNGGVPSADRIVPELQQVQVGDIFPMRPADDDTFVVRLVEPERALVLGDAAGSMSWAFVLEPVDENTTRVITRARGSYDRLGARTVPQGVLASGTLCDAAQAAAQPQATRGDGSMTAHRQRTRLRGQLKRRLPKLLAGLALTAVDSWPVRRWFSRWGTTPEELARVMPGDLLISDPTNTSTGAVTVNAPPEDIWPWLVQMGTGRGGLYSYDWLDRLFGFLDRPSATRILPEFQQLAVGDKIPWGRDELTVSVLEPLRSLALSLDAHGMEWVWQFGLHPVDDQRTRLVDRGTERLPNRPLWWLAMRVMEPAAFIMTRRFMFGVKERAEALRASAA